jgi:hypothetical protein
VAAEPRAGGIGPWGHGPSTGKRAVEIGGGGMLSAASGWEKWRRGREVLEADRGDRVPPMVDVPGEVCCGGTLSSVSGV